MKSNFTSRDNIAELQSVDPWILVILGATIAWAIPKKLPVVVTSILRELNDGISQSSTHQTGRAIDLSVKGWQGKDIEDLAEYLNKKFEKIGAISKTTGKPMACYYHNNGNGWHFHIQVRPNIKGVDLCLLS